ncbi:Uncharacterised protein [Bordetella pertussis]|nr:Uncharacterised protein [Bordetella pertussis]
MIVEIGKRKRGGHAIRSMESRGQWRPRWTARYCMRGARAARRPGSGAENVSACAAARQLRYACILERKNM